MNSIRDKGRIIISVLVCLVIICGLFLGNKVFGEAKKLNLHNATDSLMLLMELATESGDDYVQAKSDFLKILRDYTNHIEKRDLNWLLQLPPFSKKNVVKKLESVAKDLEEADDQNACKAIEKASESIAKFLTDSKMFTDEPITVFEPEVMSKEIQDAIRRSLKETHEKVERFAANESRTVDDARGVCMVNRKAIVYLYLARFGHQQIVDQEGLKNFRTDINQTIYYNRLLQQTYKEDDLNHKRLGAYSNSELRRLRLLQAIIDNDIQQAQVLLQIALIKAIPDIQI